MEEKQRAAVLDKFLSQPEDSLNTAERVLAGKIKELSDRKTKLHEHMKKLEADVQKSNQDFFALRVAIQVLVDSVVEVESAKTVANLIE